MSSRIYIELSGDDPSDDPKAESQTSLAEFRNAGGQTSLSPSYSLRRYRLRSVMTLIGPPLLVSFYCSMVGRYLIKQPANDILDAPHDEAAWLYYGWFLVAIFALDWARTALANIEAAALMMPGLAPLSAASLMWHTDMKWANPLWWIRALHSYLAQYIPIQRFREAYPGRSPTRLWVLLSLNTLLLFAAIPLSGLTFELSMVYVPSNSQTQIFGPNSTVFNAREGLGMASRIYNYWQSGRPVTPAFNGLLYAPDKTINPSLTYFDDKFLPDTSNIEFFTASATRESAVGRVFGLESSISCSPVSSSKFRLLQIHDVYNYSINVCRRDKGRNPCALDWTTTQSADSMEATNILFPQWFNRTYKEDTTSADYNISIVAAADGWFEHRISGDLHNNIDLHFEISDLANPYSRTSNHDDRTLDHFKGQSSFGDTTTAIFEIFMWQATSVEALLPPGLTQDDLGLVEVRSHQSLFNGTTSGSSVGFFGTGVSCNVETAVGYASVDPARRTYSLFEKTEAPMSEIRNPNLTTPTLPPQQLALQVLQMETEVGYSTPGALNFWIALHNAIRSGPLPLTEDEDKGSAYMALSPADLQLATYKLLGSSVIAMMDEVNTVPHLGDLRSLRLARYITSGAVPWIYVVVLLGMWAFITSSLALWLLCFAGPRWAPSLDGFEMFKLGAQYTDSLDDLRTRDFQGNDSLRGIPGMIGVLPGLGGPSVDDQDDRPGFIGLSESVADRHGQYTFDRRHAATTRRRISQRA